MEKRIFHDLAEAGNRYWWNQGRADLIRRLWKRHGAPRAGHRPRILDVGCASGGTLGSLAGLGEAWGFDRDPEALAWCRRAGHPPERLVTGDAEKPFPFPDARFDLVSAVEILEHLGSPLGALREIRRVLTKRGLLVVTVPADPRLWSDRDLRLGHRRRYRLPELVALLREADFRVVRASYANVFYYWPYRCLLAWKRRREPRGVPDVSRNTFPVPAPVSAVLTAWLKLENIWALGPGWPFGVSVFGAAVRTDAELPRPTGGDSCTED